MIFIYYVSILTGLEQGVRQLVSLTPWLEPEPETEVIVGLALKLYQNVSDQVF